MTDCHNITSFLGPIDPHAEYPDWPPFYQVEILEVSDNKGLWGPALNRSQNFPNDEGI